MSDDKSLPWAIDGANVIVYLTSVDPAQLGIGSVLCRPNDLVPLSSCFTARVIIFDIDIPITVGASVRTLATSTADLRTVHRWSCITTPTTSLHLYPNSMPRWIAPRVLSCGGTLGTHFYNGYAPNVSNVHT